MFHPMEPYFLRSWTTAWKNDIPNSNLAKALSLPGQPVKMEFEKNHFEN